jgi:hypothetical protein
VGTESLTETFGCERCGADSAEAVAEYRHQFKFVAELVEQSHFAISILQCPDCGQDWVLIFTETIDWADGNDEQHCTLLPVTKSESVQLQEPRASLNLQEKRQSLSTTLSDMSINRRYLQTNDAPEKDKAVRWCYGQLLISPHD